MRILQTILLTWTWDYDEHNFQNSDNFSNRRKSQRLLNFEGGYGIAYRLPTLYVSSNFTRIRWVWARAGFTIWGPGHKMMWDPLRILHRLQWCKSRKENKGCGYFHLLSNRNELHRQWDTQVFFWQLGWGLRILGRLSKRSATISWHGANQKIFG